MTDDEILGAGPKFAVTLGQDGVVLVNDRDGTAMEKFTGIYAILSDQPVCRANGKQSHILYIGRAQGTARLRQLVDGTHSALGALRVFLRAVGGPRPGQLARVLRPDDAPLQEVRALQAYASAFGELPPLNRRDEGYISGWVGRAIAAAVRGWPEVDAERSWDGEWAVATHAAYVIEVHVRPGGERVAALHIVYPQAIQDAEDRRAVARAGKIVVWVCRGRDDLPEREAATASVEAMFDLRRSTEIAAFSCAVRALAGAAGPPVEERLVAFVLNLPGGVPGVHP